jgi:hypothetical protein
MQKLKDSNKTLNFQSQAQTNGQAWAQQKRLNYKREQQLSYAQQVSSSCNKKVEQKWTF